MVINNQLYHTQAIALPRRSIVHQLLDELAGLHAGAGRYVLCARYVLVEYVRIDGTRRIALVTLQYLAQRLCRAQQLVLVLLVSIDLFEACVIGAGNLHRVRRSDSFAGRLIQSHLIFTLRHEIAQQIACEKRNNLNLISQNCEKAKP